MYNLKGNTLRVGLTQYLYSGYRLTQLRQGFLYRAFFQYDTMGRMTTDGLSGTAICYNALDLPRRIMTEDDSVLVNYCYLSDGSKAEALRGDGRSCLVYRGSLTYRKAANGALTLESALIPEGRLMTSDVRYHVTDHLGSVVAIVDGLTGTVLKASKYTPYGERTSNAAVPVSRPLKRESFRDEFTGKESQAPDFAVPYLDFGARHYSPSLGRWLVPDPLGEKYYDVSPYAYCDGNPVMMVDETGESIVVFSQSDNQYLEYRQRGLFYRNGRAYDGNDSFATFILQTINNIIDLGDQYVNAIITALQDSHNEHRFVYNIKYDDDVEPIGEYGKSLANEGKPVGTWIKLSLTNTAFDDVTATPETTVGHELRHAFDYDKGLQKNNVPGPTQGWKNPAEIRAVNLENRIRFRLGKELRVKYGGGKIDKRKLEDPRKKMSL